MLDGLSCSCIHISKKKVTIVAIEYSKINRRIYQCDNINANGVKQCYRKLTIYKDQSRPKLGLGQSKDYEIVKPIYL
jgi:predicted amidohydrolase